VKVLFGLLDADVGGGQRVALDIAGALRDRGHGIGLVVPSPGPTSVAFEELDAVIEFADIGRIRAPRDVTAVAKALKGFDLLYSHTTIGGQVVADVAGRIARRPHVLHQHTFPHFSSAPFTAAAQRGLARLLLRDRRFVAVAPHIRVELVRLGMSPNRVTVVPNGIDMPDVAPSRHEDGLSVGMLARFDPGKGMLDFIEAVRRLDPLPGVRFIVAGSPGPATQYEKWVRSAAASADVEIIEPDVEGRSFLEGLDVVVVPSAYEGCPLVVLEAMALRRTVVAYDVPGIRAVTGAEGAALLVPLGDLAALTQAITTAATSPSVRERLGERAREVVAARYRLADTTGQTIRILEEETSRT
jgi:glycosyltransferase involved in cell wall biosynthesis